MIRARRCQLAPSVQVLTGTVRGGSAPDTSSMTTAPSVRSPEVAGRYDMIDGASGDHVAFEGDSGSESQHAGIRAIRVRDDDLYQVHVRYDTRLNAILAPSGDQLGHIVGQASSTMTCSPLPSAAASHPSCIPSSPAKKAICLPSGDHCGARSEASARRLGEADADRFHRRSPGIRRYSGFGTRARCRRAKRTTSAPGCQMISDLSSETIWTDWACMPRYGTGVVVSNASAVVRPTQPPSAHAVRREVMRQNDPVASVRIHDHDRRGSTSTRGCTRLAGERIGRLIWRGAATTRMQRAYRSGDQVGKTSTSAVGVRRAPTRSIRVYLRDLPSNSNAMAPFAAGPSGFGSRCCDPDHVQTPGAAPGSARRAARRRWRFAAPPRNASWFAWRSTFRGSARPGVGAFERCGPRVCEDVRWSTRRGDRPRSQAVRSQSKSCEVVMTADPSIAGTRASASSVRAWPGSFGEGGT